MSLYIKRLFEFMNVKFVEERGECKKLWEEFSPHLSIFDEWDFRFSFLLVSY